MSETVLKNITLSEIRENKAALRQVNRQSEEYVELVESVRENGVFNAIVVRPIVDEETKETYYGLVDGLHRYSAACDAGQKTIPASVLDLTDAESLEAQIIGNIHKIETKPVEYSRSLQRLMAANPLLTISDMASKLSKSKMECVLDILSKEDKSPEEVFFVDDNVGNLLNVDPFGVKGYLANWGYCTPHSYVPYLDK